MEGEAFLRNVAIAIAAMASLAAAACVAPVGPVEVTRFHTANTAPLGRGTITVVPAPGMDGQSLEFRSYAAAVDRELRRVGYADASDGDGAQVASVAIARQTVQPPDHGGPVSVGVGGNAGSYGSGVGVGIGVNLSGPPAAQTATRLSVVIRDSQSGLVVWEGRASFTVKASSPLADTQLGAAKMAEALFKDFPGRSGETILVE